MHQVKFYIVLLCCIATAQTAFSQATLSIQGIIRKSNGAAVDDGKYDLTFKLYPTTSGGTAVHSETQSVNVAGGIYSTELGGGATPLTASFSQTYYLGVSVDGGAELIPRARLTSSPYSLALLGTSNLFPGAGTVGVGTISPAAGYQMHVTNVSGAGKLLLEGTTAGQIDLKKGSTVGSIGYGTANNDFVVNPGANNIALQYNGSTKLTVNNSGAAIAGNTSITGSMLLSGEAYVGNTSGEHTVLNVNQLWARNGNNPSTLYLNYSGGNVNIKNGKMSITDGGAYVNGFVEINGAQSLSNGGGMTVNGGNNYVVTIPNGFNLGNAGYTYSLKASNYLWASGMFMSSDCRIKKDFRLSENPADLATLRNLRVTDYRHIDAVQNGTAFKKGFIAQEVEEVFPEAISTAPNFIPDVYALSTRTQLSGGQMTISLEKNHGFVVGDEVKLMLANGEKKLVVMAVPSEKSFTVNWDAAAADKIFVYGKQVKDFHTVDYDRIFTLNVSATQELARQVEELKKENAALKSENSTMKASAEKFDARLRALENKLSN